MAGYWYTLEAIKRAAEMLQISPVGDEHTNVCDRLEERSANAAFEMHRMMVLVSSYVHTWIGEPYDPLREGRIIDKDWEEVLKALSKPQYFD